MSKPSKFGMLKNLSAASATEDAAPAATQARGHHQLHHRH